MMPLDFDELNRLVGFKKSMPFDQYFGGMVIDDTQKRRRMDTADRLDDEFLDILAWVFYTRQHREVRQEEIRSRVREGFRSGLDDELKSLDRSEELIDMLSDEIARTTADRNEDPFYVSQDRSRLLAEDNANNFWNMSDHEIAVSRGKRYKIWNTIMDGRERPTHNDADGQTQPIFAPFEVGNSLLMYPKDVSLDASPEELVNCRCSVTYF